MKKFILFLLAISIMSASIFAAQSRYILKPDYIACLTEEAYAQSVRLSVNKDSAGIMELFNKGQCIFTKTNTKVVLLETSWLSGRAQVMIQRNGENITLWTVHESLGRRVE